MIFPWIIALLNLSWIIYMHFKIYRFNQLIVNLVQIGTSFPQISKSIAIKNGKFEICNFETVGIATDTKLLMFQIECFKFFIDYGDVDVIVKWMIKYCIVETLTQTVYSNKNW